MAIKKVNVRKVFAPEGYEIEVVYKSNLYRRIMGKMSKIRIFYSSNGFDWIEKGKGVPSPLQLSLLVGAWHEYMERQKSLQFERLRFGHESIDSRNNIRKGAV